MNAGSSNKKTNHEIRGKRVIFTGTSIYKREAVSNKNIGLVARIRIQFTIVLASVIRSGCSPSRLIQDLLRLRLTGLIIISHYKTATMR